MGRNTPVGIYGGGGYLYPSKSVRDLNKLWKEEEPVIQLSRGQDPDDVCELDVWLPSAAGHRLTNLTVVASGSTATRIVGGNIVLETGAMLSILGDTVDVNLHKMTVESIVVQVLAGTVNLTEASIRGGGTALRVGWDVEKGEMCAEPVQPKLSAGRDNSTVFSNSTESSTPSEIAPAPAPASALPGSGYGSASNYNATADGGDDPCSRAGGDIFLSIIGNIQVTFVQESASVFTTPQPPPPKKSLFHSLSNPSPFCSTLANRTQSRKLAP